MATKTISITEDAYKRLLNLKKENESFSMIIGRITGKRKISDFRGILSKKSADELEKAIRGNRKKRNKLHRARIKKINKALE
ncbi:hypothetical protein BMS3Abin17_00177 [archaeon BMS3Abin17]|nr:hypothetical protein BMS3Abin17_00177 [archaeon BMS3Abin17]HDZ60464.1 hypothetical protein [Candidatus Pacearchaeota archaeon]